MEVDAKTLRGKGFNPSLTDVTLPFSALLAYLENLAPTFDDLKVILAPFPLGIFLKNFDRPINFKLYQFLEPRLCSHPQLPPEC